MTSFNPYQEEDDGYLAAKTGQGLSENPYPRGTIRYKQWRQGWHIKCNEIHNREDEGYLAADAGQSVSENPHPAGTIRYERWRQGWHIRHDEIRRVARLGIQV